MPTKPTAQHLDQLTEALLNGFNHDELTRFTRSQFDQELEWITPVAGKRDLTTIVSDLVRYFASQEQGLQHLLAAALLENPFSRLLNILEEEWEHLEFEAVDLPPDHPLIDAEVVTKLNPVYKGDVDIYVEGDYIVYDTAPQPPPGTLSLANFTYQPQPLTQPSTVHHETRRLDAAMPSECTYDEPTEVRALIALPDSKGLEAFLPDCTKDGDLINKKDARSSYTAPVEFPIDPYTGEVKNTKLHLYLDAPGFEIKDASVSLLLLPEADSGIATFFLTPQFISGTGRAKVELYDHNDALLGSVSLVTKVRLSPLGLATDLTWQLVSLTLAKVSDAISPDPEYAPATPYRNDGRWYHDPPKNREQNQNQDTIVGPDHYVKSQKRPGLLMMMMITFLVMYPKVAIVMLFKLAFGYRTSSKFSDFVDSEFSDAIKFDKLYHLIFFILIIIIGIIFAYVISDEVDIIEVLKSI